MSKNKNFLNLLKNPAKLKVVRGVPVAAKLNDYLENEAKAWEDEWKQGVSKNALAAYKLNMRVFEKLKFWEESGRASKHLPTTTEMTVLDLGCGNGFSTSNIRGFIVVGADLSLTQMTRAKKNYPDKNFVVADATSLPFKNNVFDVIVATNLLHHVTNPQKILSECHRVLKKGGQLLTVDPNLTNPIGFTGRGLFRLLKLKKLFPTFPQFALGEDERQFTKGEYYKLYKNSPFKTYKIIPHRIERLLFFATILVPPLVHFPFYENILIFFSSVGNKVVKIEPFDYLCYFWICEAQK